MNTPNQEYLFPEINPARYGDKKRHQNLFIPKYFQQKAYNSTISDETLEIGYKIICKWADLEASGKLEKKKETALEGEFLTQIFGDVLGYVLFSDHRKEWNLEPKYRVNGGEADAAIGLFQTERKNTPTAFIEFKGPTADLDRDRFNGRTAVQQCWDYLDEEPHCPWGIVSNYVSFRLYHRNHTPKRYQLFVLQDLRNKETFKQFYYIFGPGGIIAPPAKSSHAEQLLKETSEQRQIVGDDLYSAYHSNRIELIQHLHKVYNKPIDQAIRITQKLLDRIIFVAFCQDRGLLPEKSILKAFKELPPFTQVTNPQWQNFLQLFRSIDKGNKRLRIPPFNGGLFKEDDEIDNLQLDDKWTNFFKNVGDYDFRDEINVDVLGHLFERSIHDIEKIRSGAFFDSAPDVEAGPKMIKSAERKRGGIFYTPPEFTDFITNNTVSKVIEQRFNAINGLVQANINIPDSDLSDSKKIQYLQECLTALQQIKIVDPACGSGAFLISAYNILEDKYQEIVNNLSLYGIQSIEPDDIPDIILRNNLFGVDLSPDAVEIAQLALWIRTAREGKPLSELTQNIICGNSLVDDPDIDARALDWEKTFPAIFSREESGFDCVIGNPPWERMKLQEREYFDSIDPNIASAVDAATRRKLIKQLEKTNPEIHDRFSKAKDSADKTQAFVRSCDKYPLTGKGDINTYTIFAELAYRIVSPQGRAGLLVPSGIATEHTTKEFFSNLVNTKAIVAVYDFENNKPIFVDVHRSFKFCILLFNGAKWHNEKADFAFFSHDIEDLKDKNRHISLNKNDFMLLNPNTGTCPIFRTKRDAELTKAIYKRVPVLIDNNRIEGGNPWGAKFLRMFDQTNDAELFYTTEKLKADGYKLKGNKWTKGKKIFLPLYEAKMFRPYDHRYGSVYVKAENWVNQGQTIETTLIEHQNPEFVVQPRWWIESVEVKNKLLDGSSYGFLAFRDITRATDSRTLLASFIPYSGVVNTAPLIIFDKNMSAEQGCCLLANLNSYILDFVVRQKIGHIHINFFIIEQLPIFGPDAYRQRCPWNKRITLESWISNRVLKLTCTSNDMIPLAEAAGFDPPVHKWKPDERAELMAELDAAFFILYRIDREDVEYILSTFSGNDEESAGFFAGASPREMILRHYDKLMEASK
jgi:hypothetical protein